MFQLFQLQKQITETAWSTEKKKKSSMRRLCALAQAEASQLCQGTEDGCKPALVLLVLEVILAPTFV